jgi:hypothetical protein
MALPFMLVAPLLAVAMSCVLIPYPTRPDVARSEAVTIADEDTLVTLGPRKLLEKVTKEIQEANPAIDVVDGLTFRDVAFPEGNWNLARLLEAESCERVRKQLGVDYLVLVGPMSYVEGEPKGHFDLWVGGFGAAQVDIESRLAAVIVDLKTRESVSQVTAEAHGKQTAAGFFYFVVTIPMTDSAAIRGLGSGVAWIITERTASESVRIAVMAGEPASQGGETLADELSARETPVTFPELPPSSYSSAQLADLTPAEVRALAEAGDKSAQLYLYRSSKEPQRLIWLCRSADSGLVEASYRLGRLYQHGQQGLPRDHARAYLWYRLASVGGHIQGRIELEDMLSEMSARQIDKGRRLFREWKPGQCELEIIPHMTSK